MEVKTGSMVLFWRADTPFSNWWSCEQKIYADLDKTVQFDNSEALFMWLKALLFKDYETATKIIQSDQSPKEMKRLGREVKGFEQTKWDESKYDLMYVACLSKFEADPKLVKYLLDTGDLEIVEASPYDKIWGIGLAPDDPKALDKANWKGENLLGKVLMELRAYFIECDYLNTVRVA